MDYNQIQTMTEGNKFYSLDLDLKTEPPLIREHEFGEIYEINEHNGEFFYTKGGWFYAKDLSELINGKIIVETDNWCHICLTKEPLIALLQEHIKVYTTEIVNIKKG